MGKIGRKLKNLVYDNSDNQVVGLSYDTAADSYFCRYKDEQDKTVKKNFGRDKTTAIDKYRRWLSARAGGARVIYEKPSHLYNLASRTVYSLRPKIKAELEKQGVNTVDYLSDKVSAFTDEVETIVKESMIDEEDIWDFIREYILADRSFAARKLKIPAIANQKFLEDLAKPHTLEEIGHNYFTKVKFQNLSVQPQLEFDKVKKTWERFVKDVGVKTVTELTKDKIKVYYESLYSEYKKKDLSTTWLRGYMERVIRVLNTAADELDNSSDIVDAKQRCRLVFNIPKPIIKNPPKIITKEAFHLILAESNVEEKALWLVSLNLAYYVADLIALPKDAIDFNTGAVIFCRTKNGYDRAGVLWAETLQAIKDYQEAMPHNGDYLFLSQHKAAFASSTVSKKLTDVMKRTIKKEEEKKTENNNYKPIKLVYTHCHFRDSFQSICAQQNIPQRAIDAVMGHKTEASKYTTSASLPEISKPACQAVRDYYFADKDVENSW